ncbi:hypothetical protein, partial [Cronobacter malonaticus]|uniref:hypothetical protein n=1 Tax=Cronobacter malonaticus TaxID=413503 RepID=UPI001F24A4D4
HWSNHREYTGEVRKKLENVLRKESKLSDTQLAFTPNPLVYIDPLGWCSTKLGKIWEHGQGMEWQTIT